MSKFGKWVDEPLGGYVSPEDVKELAESMGVKLVEEKEKHPIAGSTNIYSIGNRGLIRYSSEQQEEDQPDVRAYILLHELGHIRMGHGRGRGTPVGAVLEELEADKWAFTVKRRIPMEDYVTAMLSAKAQDVGIFEFGLTKREAWRATVKAAKRFGVPKTLIAKGEKLYWKDVGRN